MNVTSNKRLALVHPVLRERVEDVAAELVRKNIFVEVVSGFRSTAEQARLYAQGRTTKGKRVTNAKAGYSWHNFGLAVDLCPMKRGAFDWNAPLTVWHEIGATAKRHHLEWGGDWRTPDRPHLQLAVAQTLTQCRNWEGSVTALWRVLRVAA